MSILFETNNAELIEGTPQRLARLTGGPLHGDRP